MTELYAKYLKYLRSDHWKALRKLLFKLNANQCRCCNSNQYLVGHHLRYRDDLSTCTVDDLMCLCDICHDILHRGLKRNRLPLPDSVNVTIALITKYRDFETRHPRPVKPRKQKAPKPITPKPPRHFVSYKALRKLILKFGRKELNAARLNEVIALIEKMRDDLAPAP